MRLSFIFSLLVMCYMAYAELDCPGNGRKMEIPGLPCNYLCDYYSSGSVFKTKDGRPCTAPGVPKGICRGAECTKN
uniref:Putative salivary kunitz domain protein n=1 Tax=Ixodes ricinus TaxID=34613 RepID=A0A0K8R8F7_IXORI